jgi:hypothetical protein
MSVEWVFTCFDANADAKAGVTNALYD